MALAELSDFDQNFVLEYVKDFNGVKAAERAGHQGSYGTLGVTAHRLLKNAKIREAIKEIISTRAMSAEEVLARLADTARFDPSDFFMKKRGKHYINLDAIKQAGLGHIIKELSYDRKGNLVVKFDDRQGALDKMARHLGLYVDPGSTADNPIYHKMVVMPPKNDTPPITPSQEETHE